MRSSPYSGLFHKSWQDRAHGVLRNSYTADSCPSRLPSPLLLSINSSAMIEPFSLATGIVGILNLSIEITTIAKEYVGSARQAPNEVQDLALQTDSLSDVLKKLV